MISVTGSNAPKVKEGDVIVKVDPRYFRPAEVDELLGDSSKARSKLGWSPEISAQEMCSEMVVEDLVLAKKQILIENHEN